MATKKTARTTTKTTTKTTTAAPKKAPPTKRSLPLEAPPLSTFVPLIGQRRDSDDVVAAIAAFRFTLDKADKMPGEPHTTWLRREKLGVTMTCEDDVVVGVAVDDLFAGALFDGVTMGQARADTRKALGPVVEEQRFHDTFRVTSGVAGAAGDGLRITTNTIRDALVGVDVEPWQHLPDRLARDRWSEEKAAPPIDAGLASVLDASRRPLPPAWSERFPDLTALRALLGQRLVDSALPAFVRAGHLRRDQGESGAMLHGDDVGIVIAVDGIDDDAVVSIVQVGSDWGGGYEASLLPGAVRRDVRRALGPPTQEHGFGDIWEADGLRRDIAYAVADRVVIWSVRRS